MYYKCIYKKGAAMGDLKKKKKVDHIIKANDGEEFLIESGELSTDDETIERLRAYIKKFYNQQLEKDNKKKEK